MGNNPDRDNPSHRRGGNRRNFGCDRGVGAPSRAKRSRRAASPSTGLKEIVPIWKKEHFEGGEVWIGCQTSHPPHLHAAKIAADFSRQV